MAAPGGWYIRGIVPRFLSSAVLYPELLVVWAFWALSLHCLHNTGCIYDTPGTWSLEMHFVGFSWYLFFELLPKWCS